MANGLYASYKQDLLDKLHDMNTDGIRAVLTDAGNYTPNLATDHFYNGIISAARIAVSGDLASPTIVGGVFDTADFTWTSVSGTTAEGVVLFNNGMSGADTGRGLIANYDTTVTGLPVTPNGGNINVTVNASGWFSL